MLENSKGQEIPIAWNFEAVLAQLELQPAQALIQESLKIERQFSSCCINWRSSKPRTTYAILVLSGGFSLSPGKARKSNCFSKASQNWWSVFTSVVFPDTLLYFPFHLLAPLALM